MILHRAPPRWLCLEDAATYVGLRPSAFRRRVTTGVLPAPSLTLGPARWDRLALDAAMEGTPTSKYDLQGAIDAAAAEIRARPKRKKKEASSGRLLPPYVNKE